MLGITIIRASQNS